jgi:hypothetical protein
MPVYGPRSCYGVCVPPSRVADDVHVPGSRTASTTGRIASITTSGVSKTKPWLLFSATTSRIKRNPKAAERSAVGPLLHQALPGHRQSFQRPEHLRAVILQWFVRQH